ncbi:hypothetical protein [Chitinophaga pinensis]|uniref:hypothetical protein n=1 Tax=Chitinophaga pinensis TaxID=79329 RepID=UPI001C991007|nr:hypothetical protein [Chitinophaga pinensis]
MSGYHQQADETTLLSAIYERCEQSLVDHPLLNSNKLTVVNDLLSFLLGKDKETRPYPNPLHKAFFSAALIQPEGKQLYIAGISRRKISLSVYGHLT